MIKDNSNISNNKNSDLRHFSKVWLYYQDNINIAAAKKLLKKGDKCQDMFLNGFCPKCKTLYQKQIFCNKEYCTNRTCQEKSHLRRWARALPKYAQFQNFGYFVITFPQEIREPIGKTFLRNFRNFIWYLLQKYLGKTKAIFRYHFFGDAFYKCENIQDCEFKSTAKNKVFPICNNFYYECMFKKPLKNIFNPHLNILIDYKFIDKDILENIKLDCLKWIKNNIHYNNDNIVIHYQYYKSLAQAMHWLKYVFRSTSRVLKGNEIYIFRFYKFRNVQYKGKYNTNKKEYLNIIKNKFGEKIKEEVSGDTIKIINKICIICDNDKIEWDKGIKRFLLMNVKEIKDSGFYYQVYKKN